MNYPSLLKYILETGAPITSGEGQLAAGRGFLDCLKILEDHDVVFDTDVLNEGAEGGQQHVVQYLMLEKNILPNSETALGAVKSGKIDLLKFILSSKSLNRCIRFILTFSS